MYDALLDEELVEAGGVAGKLTDDDAAKELDDVGEESIDVDPDVEIDPIIDAEDDSDEASGSEESLPRPGCR